MQIFVTKDYQEMSEAAANMIVDLVEEKPGCVLGLATGSTPEASTPKSPSATRPRTSTSRALQRST